MLKYRSYKRHLVVKPDQNKLQLFERVRGSAAVSDADEGLNFKLDVSTLSVRSAGRFLSVIWETFVTANAFTRVRDFVASAFAPVNNLAFATAA